jgi:hypothetical protein
MRRFPFPFREVFARARNRDWQFGTKFAGITGWQENLTGYLKEFWQMASQIVMDHTGDTRHQFDAGAVSKAEERFQSLTRWASRRLYGHRPVTSR